MNVVLFKKRSHFNLSNFSTGSEPAQHIFSTICEVKQSGSVVEEDFFLV